MNTLSLGASNTGALVGQQVVTIGKEISSKLSVGYEQSLAGIGGIVKLTYELSRNWSVAFLGGSMFRARHSLQQSVRQLRRPAAATRPRFRNRIDRSPTVSRASLAAALDTKNAAQSLHKHSDVEWLLKKSCRPEANARLPNLNVGGNKDNGDAEPPQSKLRLHPEDH